MIIVDDQTHRIYWQYNTGPKGLMTKCAIQVTPAPTIWAGDTAFVAITRFHTDKCDKEKARRTSLKKLLKTYYDGSMNKSFRQKIWDTYRTLSFNKPKW